MKTTGSNLTCWGQRVDEGGKMLFPSATVYDIRPQGDRLIGLVHVPEDYPGASHAGGKAELTVWRPYGREDIWEVL